MATQRQIEANRRNGALGGPRTEAGKARSRVNATKHALAGESAAVEAGLSAEFRERRAKWAVEQRPDGEAAEWALDRAVAASLRIERCERAIDELVAETRARARLAWDQDRAVEAATAFGRLARDPILASRQLETTLAGAGLLVEAWLGLASTLRSGGDWSESEASRALDLLGVAADGRSGRSPVDAPEGSDPVGFRLGLALEEVERLEELCEQALGPLEEMERRRAMAGDVALLSKSARLVLRYERDAWRRYRESMKEVKAPAASPVAAPSPVVAGPPGARERPTPIRPEAVDPFASLVVEDEEAWLAELERRFEALPEARGSARPLATERTQFGGVSIEAHAR